MLHAQAALSCLVLGPEQLLLLPLRTPKPLPGRDIPSPERLGGCPHTEERTDPLSGSAFGSALQSTSGIQLLGPGVGGTMGCVTETTNPTKVPLSPAPSNPLGVLYFASVSQAGHAGGAMGHHAAKWDQSKRE